MTAEVGRKYRLAGARPDARAVAGESRPFAEGLGDPSNLVDPRGQGALGFALTLTGAAALSGLSGQGTPALALSSSATATFTTSTTQVPIALRARPPSYSAGFARLPISGAKRLCVQIGGVSAEAPERSLKKNVAQTSSARLHEERLNLAI